MHYVYLRMIINIKRKFKQILIILTKNANKKYLEGVVTLDFITKQITL